MIPQGLRPIAGLLTIAMGLLVIVNHWIGLLESDVDLLTSHAIGIIGLLSGMNIMSASSEMKEEARASYVEDAQTKF
tara:strand:- start:90 stop:320 length:231 start_codon:yes stop_codon:yes gene_type:complete